MVHFVNASFVVTYTQVDTLSVFTRSTDSIATVHTNVWRIAVPFIQNKYGNEDPSLRP